MKTQAFGSKTKSTHAKKQNILTVYYGKFFVCIFYSISSSTQRAPSAPPDFKVCGTASCQRHVNSSLTNIIWGTIQQNLQYMQMLKDLFFGVVFFKCPRKMKNKCDHSFQDRKCKQLSSLNIAKVNKKHYMQHLIYVVNKPSKVWTGLVKDLPKYILLWFFATVWCCLWPWNALKVTENGING